MTQKFTASVWKEGDYFVAHSNEVEVASQGFTKNEALENLKEAIELYFEEPKPDLLPEIFEIEAEINAA